MVRKKNKKKRGEEREGGREGGKEGPGIRDVWKGKREQYGHGTRQAAQSRAQYDGTYQMPVPMDFHCTLSGLLVPERKRPGMDERYCVFGSSHWLDD